MSRKLRVFISSTMSDLANERDAVIQKLSAFNFEPVNAESWAARETRPWDRIEAEIRSSDLFVLILGDRYGFEPGEGPGAAEGLSVTHLEYRAARDAEQMPILVFLKWLDADNTKEDKKRDEFRDEPVNRFVRSAETPRKSCLLGSTPSLLGTFQRRRISLMNFSPGIGTRKTETTETP